LNPTGSPAYRGGVSRVALQPAYILHSRPYRETSQLLEIFSREHGRVGAVARGARGPRSRWKGILQPFRHLLLGWSQRGDLATLTGADQVAAPPPLSGEASYCGLYINELLVRLMHRGDPHPELWEYYRDTLAGLSRGENVQPVLRLFEKHLLDATGFGLLLDRDNGGQPLNADAWYEYRPGLGAVRVADSASGKSAVTSGRALLALHEERIEADDLVVLRDVMRRVIRYHLGDKPLASESLYRASSSARRRRTETEPSS
jgi:DNA repair protein RecO (recombination protein O)